MNTSTPKPPGLTLVGSTSEKMKEASVQIELSMFGAPGLMQLEIQDIGTFQNVLDALETQGYIDGIHTGRGQHCRAYKFPGIIVLKQANQSGLVVAAAMPGGPSH